MTEIIERTQEDSKSIEAYIENIYSQKVVPPSPPSKNSLSFWKLSGLEAMLFTISAISGAILSSIRTGGLFYLLEIKLLTEYNIDPFITNLLAISALITSLATFEGFLLAFGFYKGKANGKLNASVAGLLSSFIVVLAAGVFSGLGIVNNIPENIRMAINVSLALITGLGAAFVVFFSSENIGFTVTSYEHKKKNIINEYQELYQDWRRHAVQSYMTSHYYKSSKNVQNTFNNEQNLNKSSMEVQNTFNLPTKESKFEQSLLAIENFVNQYGRLPKIDELVEIGISRGYASMAINKFIVDNGDKLIHSGIIDEDRLNSAIRKQ